MDLDEFVSETIRQILAGVTKAQAGEHGMNVNAASSGGHSGGNIMDNGSYGVFTRVDFDVAVTAESSVGGKGSIKVWALGAEGGKESKSQSVSRVVFSLPVRLPSGDQSIERERESRYRAAQAANTGSDWGG